jgi:predicted MFS family arabinose efflux permease
MATHIPLRARTETMTEPSARRWAALVCIALGQLMLALDATIVNVALPTIERALAFSEAIRPWMVSAYLLPFAVLLLPAGRLSDSLGQKRAFLIGALGFAAGSALGGAARYWPILLLARGLQGAFAALLAPSALSLVAMCFSEPRERGRAFGVYGAVAACGGALGLVLGGVLTRFADWRWCLYVNVAFAAASSAGVSLWLHAPPRAIVRKGWWRTLVALLGERDRRVTAAVAALSVAAMSGLFLLLTYHFQQRLGLSALETGLAFLPLSVGAMLGSSVVARRLLPRLAPRWLVALALGVAMGGLLLLAPVDADSPFLWHVAPAELLVGGGIGAAMMPTFSLATLGVSPDNAGLASALISSAQQLGGGIGAALLNTVATSLGSLPRAPGVVTTLDGFSLAALAGAGLLGCAALCARQLGPRQLGQTQRVPSALGAGRTGEPSVR